MSRRHSPDRETVQWTCDPGIIDGHEARVTGHHNVTPRVAYDDQSDGFSSTVNQ